MLTARLDIERKRLPWRSPSTTRRHIELEHPVLSRQSCLLTSNVTFALSDPSPMSWRESSSARASCCSLSAASPPGPQHLSSHRAYTGPCRPSAPGRRSLRLSIPDPRLHPWLGRLGRPGLHPGLLPGAIPNGSTDDASREDTFDSPAAEARVWGPTGPRCSSPRPAALGESPRG